MMSVRLFGAFRNLQSEPEIRLDVPESVKTIGDLRAHLGQYFKTLSNPTFDAAGLLTKSAIANDRQVLQDEMKYDRTDRLALLPPVSGG